MIDIALVRTDPDLVRRTCRLKGSDVDVEQLIAVDEQLRRNQVRMEELRASQKRQGKGTGVEAARGVARHVRTVHRGSAPGTGISAGPTGLPAC